MNHHELETKRKQHHEQQKSYVSALVDVTVQVISSIWPNSNIPPSPGSKPIADLNTFLHHILKHSRTTHSTLQLAIFYLFRIRPRVLGSQDVYISCGRRMFLAALISAHKFLQDKTYKNTAWSKVSGLNVKEINHAEKIILDLLDYRLFVKKDTYDRWIVMLQTHLKLQPLTSSTGTIPATSTTTTATYQRVMHSAISKAEQSLPSPPLEEDTWIPLSHQLNKRRLSFEDDGDDSRLLKRR
ncbi:hypothetical protein K501DRAFT_175131 [Backusella circina FSU 941]|nr:hypothetical protein K501DRAFT_175131 [Backusella circina FSU 941]